MLGADFLPHSTETAEQRHPKMVWKLCSWIGILLKLAAEAGWGGVRLFKSGSSFGNVSLPSGVPSFARSSARSRKLPRVRKLLASSPREAGAEGRRRRHSDRQR